VHDSLGPKNEPQYSGAGVPADAADLTEVAAYAAKVGNRRSDLDSVRTGLTGADLWDGLQFYATDTKLTWLYQGPSGSGSWVQVFGDTGWSTLSLTGTGWTSAGDGTYATAKIRVKNGRVLIRGILSKTSWAAFDVVTALATQYRPGDAATLVCRIGAGTPGTARVLANGNLQVEEAGTGFIVIDGGWELN
jgi:hypothetical protein